MRGRALDLLARMARRLAGGIRGFGRRDPDESGPGGAQRDGPQRDVFASYSMPARRRREPPYASLRQ